MASTSHRFQTGARAAVKSFFAAGLLLTAGFVSADGQVKVDDSTFKCITQMTKVRHFYVDNLNGNLKQTVKIAKAGKGTYPVGTVLQLVPGEAMVKREKGFSPATKDWEFFFIDVSPEGSKIKTRGFAEVNNGLGLNCFACHVKAKPEFDFVCELTNGCDPIPITRPMLGALQRTDPRCKNNGPVSPEDQKALQELGDAVKELLKQKGKA